MNRGGVVLVRPRALPTILDLRAGRSKRQDVLPAAALRAVGTRQSLRAAGTLPPLFSSSRMTALRSHMFISALPSFGPW
jgi:hypothetical protein